MEAEYRAAPSGFRRKGALAILAGSVVAGGIAVAVIYLHGSKLAERQDPSLLLKDARASLAERLQAANVALDRGPAKAPPPTLGVEDQSGTINAPLPIGVEIENPTHGATVKLGGLLPGTALDVGVASGQGEWRIRADDLSKAKLIPPRDYVGSMAIVAELQGGNGQVIVRSRVRYAWRQPVVEPRERVEAAPPAVKPPTTIKAEAPTTKAPAATNADTSAPTRQIDPDEVAVLLKRSKELVSSGDLAAARLLLQRVAETHNAQAALELGATYDPIVIKQRGIFSAAPDPALAQVWYQRARNWGSADASRHLESLATALR